ncbi:uncharacterized protein LOC141704451 isoform X2 [Apium graveolens]|uniref:uncharacterized protein LOC141704451 isoform X2 n=1 Tax=Apium graveolens TaxID=4045 RepID=UPI003D7B8F4C
MPAKHKCIWCGKLLFYEHKISIHLKYFGGLNAIRTNKQSKQKKGKNPELNRSEKGKGVESVDEGKEESSKKGKHYNKDKTFGAGSSTNKSEGVEYGSCNGKSTLHSVKWDRIILEEEASIGMTFVRMGFFTTNCMFDKFLNRLLVIPLSTLAGLSRSVIDYLSGATFQITGFFSVHNKNTKARSMKSLTKLELLWKLYVMLRTLLQLILFMVSQHIHLGRIAWGMRL